MATVLPNFLIIGAMRSGTTSLVHYLRGLPEVFMSRKKEVHYFDQEFQRGPTWYSRWFAGANGQRAIGEATPAYMYCPEAPARMAQVIPGARLIAILRDPVDRAYSHYWHNRVRGKEHLEFADAIAAEPERLSSGPQGRSTYSYLDRGRYLAQLLNVCRYYPREALLVVLFEELRDLPVETFQAVSRFLGVDPSFVPSNVGEPTNYYAAFRSVAYRKLVRGMPFLPRWARTALKKLNVQHATYPRMAPALRARLRESFAQDNAALAAWLGRDLSAWNR